MLDVSNDALELLDSIRCIQQGLEQAKRGEGVPVDDYFAAFRKKRGLAGPNA